MPGNEILQITETGDGADRTLHLCGELDISGVDQAITALESTLREPGCTSLVINMSGLSFLDASGARALATGVRMADDSGVGLRFVGARGLVEVVMQVCGLASG